ncbi:unnamed protein product [Tilletia laevis]|uniref:Cytochrome c oxidase subunit n=1 Tax=Tilletia laevis TaxID=157183 RepID=A0A9N8QAF3_9BASI|nr:unnamed protein product [Tilletia laevis]
MDLSAPCAPILLLHLPSPPSSRFVRRPVSQPEPEQALLPEVSKAPSSLQLYLDYFRCINAKGEEHTPCKHFYRKYHSLCPNEWIAKWDEQRENNAFPASLEP